MIPDFYVFNTDKAAELIKTIEETGFNAFVSGKSDYEWLKKKFTDPKKYLIFWSPEKYGHVEDNIHDTPLFCISLQEEYIKWNEVIKWVQSNVFKQQDYNVDLCDLDFTLPAIQHREYLPPGKNILYNGVTQYVSSYPPEKIDLKKGYSFNSIYDELLDVKYFEVYSPSSETPFTVVVNNYSKKDDSWLFTDIYASNAWASNNMECRYDFHFLTVLWKHLCLPGEFNMDIVKRRVDACYPDRVKDVNDLQSEPQVYRRPMAEVMGMKRKRCNITP